MKCYTKSYSIPGLTTCPSEVFLIPISRMRERQLQRLSQTLTVRCHMLPAALRPSLIYIQELLGWRRRWSWSKCPSLLDQQLEQPRNFHPGVGPRLSPTTRPFPVVIPLLEVTHRPGRATQSRACSGIGIQLCSSTPALEGKAERGREGNKKLQPVSSICNVIYVFPSQVSVPALGRITNKWRNVLKHGLYLINHGT